MRATFGFLLLATALPLFATEPNPSVRQRELVIRLLDVTRANQASLAMMDAMMGQFEKQSVEAAEAQGADAVAEAKETFEAFRTKMKKLDIETLMQNAYVQIYSKYFSEQELEDLIAFYTTPLGQKSIETMPDLMREGMDAAVRELTPKMEQITAEVMAEQEKKRPWRRTMSDLRKVSSALEGYAADHDQLYPDGDYASLEETLEEYLDDDFPAQDIWEHAYAYSVSPDRKQFRLVSAGADSIFDWDSRRIVPLVNGEREIRYRERLEDDVILDDWGFIQLPMQAKPKREE